jgi:hypothetical protein
MKIFGALVALAIAAAACTTAQQQTASTVTQSGAAVCEVVFTVADPTLSPLCTTAEAVEEAIQALIASVAPVAAPADAGAVAARKLAVATPVHPTNVQIYQYLLAHGAVTLKQ